MLCLNRSYRRFSEGYGQADRNCLTLRSKAWHSLDCDDHMVLWPWFWHPTCLASSKFTTVLTFGRWTNKKCGEWTMWPTYLLTYLLTYWITYSLTPWCSALLEQLTGLQLVKKFPHHFTEPEGSLPYSQASATCLYPGPAQSSPYTHNPPSWRSILILSTHLRLGLPSGADKYTASKALFLLRTLSFFCDSFFCDLSVNADQFCGSTVSRAWSNTVTITG